MPGKTPDGAGRAAAVLAGAVAFLWPAGIVLSMRFGCLAGFLWAALAVFALRLAFLARSAARSLPRAAAPAVGAAVCAAGLAAGTADAPLWYPVLMNAAMLGLFAGSLLSGTPVAERFARAAADGELPERAVRYCRRVTQAWCVFFVANGAVALWSVLSGSERFWFLWNGVASYICIGLFALGEYLLRRRLQHAGDAL